jgi:hypothetical protein
MLQDSSKGVVDVIVHAVMTEQGNTLSLEVLHVGSRPTRDEHFRTAREQEVR